MKSEKEALLVLTTAGMEIAWRCAWSSFLALALIQRPFPLPVALGAFAASAFCTRLHRRRNWRRFQAVLLQAAGLVTAALLFIQRTFFSQLPLFDGGWITDLMSMLKVPRQWFILLPMLGCLLLFWLGGRTVAKSPRTYFPVCLQFDKGLGALFLLLLIKFIIQVKGGLPLEDPATGFLVVAFLLFSLVSIGLARGRGDARKSFLAGYHGIGIILSFTTIVILCGSALILLTFPFLTQIADAANVVLQEAAAPLGPIIVAILRFIFAPKRFRTETGGSGTTGAASNMAPPPDAGSWVDALVRAVGWGLIGVLALLAIGVCGYLLYVLVCWLLKRPPADNAHLQSPDRFLRRFLKLMSLLAAIFRSVRRKILFLSGWSDSAAAVYAGILRWGRRSGLPPAPSETPAEYGKRLIHGFPQLEEDIELIIEAFNREIYGGMATERMLLGRIAAALRRMRNPRHWPSRLLGWFGPP